MQAQNQETITSSFLDKSHYETGFHINVSSQNSQFLLAGSTAKETSLGVSEFDVRHTPVWKHPSQ